MAYFVHIPDIHLWSMLQADHISSLPVVFLVGVGRERLNGRYLLLPLQRVCYLWPVFFSVLWFLLMNGFFYHSFSSIVLIRCWETGDFGSSDVPSALESCILWLQFLLLLFPIVTHTILHICVLCTDKPTWAATECSNMCVTQCAGITFTVRGNVLNWWYIWC